MSTSVRPADWKSLAPQIPNFASQKNSLPRLPVPPLARTLDRLKTSLRPLARSDDEYRTVVRKIDEFGSGIAPLLQEKLEQRQQNTVHWLEEWWDDYSYLAYRDPVVVYVSYYYGFEPQPVHLPQTPAARAAAITRSAMLFRRSLRAGQISPDGTPDNPLCMDTYRWMFDCCRIPGIPVDQSISYAGSPNPDTDLGHVIVIRKNRFWKLKAEVEGNVLGMGELIKQFQYIYDQSTTEYPAVGALTASDRDTWAKDFTLLASVPLNAKHLYTVHSSAFVVSLDDSYPPPVNEVDVSRALWHGVIGPTPSQTPLHISRALESRYVDKPVQFVVFDNGIAGLMGEHSVMDGTPTARMCDDILTWLADPSFDFGLSTTRAIQAPEPVPLDFDLSGIPAIQTSITSAKDRLHALASAQALSFVRTKYGKRAIKSCGVGPDGWAQLVIQLAYSRLAAREAPPKGKVTPWPVGTYEAASTRRFFKGRTETIRVVTNEAVDWVRSMEDPTSDKEQRLSLFKKAVTRHGVVAREAGMAEGVDRHMLGLKLSLPPSTPLPELYNDPLYIRGSRWTLSTSAIFSNRFREYGWGAVVPEGFGVAYVTGFDDFLQFTITSRAEMPNAEFAKEIERAAEDTYRLFTEADLTVGRAML
ncbi:carnitine acetyl transferase [Pisolithus croceorrhizus]|nr:carnitine acetyl transferase [Pisolithus croceorrhizus]